ncbi:cold-shock protein [Kutzneria sp. CA-103260]|uniref:cold-shock protein n=1 Tax=Kutzneria sp. CA-103260 TaxID=2802641 RepID=UPI001BADFC27|nr:cold shock domain-containing protein [Kutzneria sp. CA-103260]QUQ68781.1 cold shock protein CspA [Kutzneria sp. CA-103260]
MARGVVTWFSQDLGFGFIAPDRGGPDICVDDVDIEELLPARKDGRPTLAPGQWVEYERASGTTSAGLAVRVRPV